jgi:hypothetical protein
MMKGHMMKGQAFSTKRLALFWRDGGFAQFRQSHKLEDGGKTAAAQTTGAGRPTTGHPSREGFSTGN